MLPKKTTRPASPLPSFVDEESSSHYFESADPGWVWEWRREDAAAAAAGTPRVRLAAAAMARTLGGSERTTRGQAVWVGAVGLGLLLALGLGGTPRSGDPMNMSPAMPVGAGYVGKNSLGMPSFVPREAHDIKEATSDAAVPVDLPDGASNGEEPTGTAGAAAAATVAHADVLDQEHALQQRVRAMSFAKYNRVDPGAEAEAAAAVPRDILVEMLLRGVPRPRGDEARAPPSETRAIVIRVSTASESFAAYYFLEQVQYGLWTGAAIEDNAPTHLVVRPATARLVSDSIAATTSRDLHPLLEDWRALGLHLLPRSEEPDPGLPHDVLPHDPYTLCFAPSGDATVLHLNKVARPDRTEEACAGRVVRGRAVLEGLFALPPAGPGHRLPRPVEIVELRFLGPIAFGGKDDAKDQSTSLSE